MRIVIDLQGAQTESRFRGIGRYSLSLALAMARNAGNHEIWLVLNGAFVESILDIRQAFQGLIPSERICVFDIAMHVAESDPLNSSKARVAEIIREYFIRQLQPDIVLVTSLFEGYVDNAVTSIGTLSSSASTNVAIILYDLIPLLNAPEYLPTTIEKQYYNRKIQSLKNANLILSISEFSRQEAMKHLGLANDRIVNISAGVATCFKRDNFSEKQIKELRQRYDISRKIILYVPGGGDTRKNVGELIVAYSLLPAELRAVHQLVIAGRYGEAGYRLLERMRKHVNLGADELVTTGYLSDEDLIVLYSEATLFVFPSKYEGFGLPILEAMACGVPVIGSNSTSIPEVIGREDALFDAESACSIKDKMQQVLQDKQFYHQLKEHGFEQVKKFSWDDSAKRTLHALEEQVKKQSGEMPALLSVDIEETKKLRLAFVSPLPPERTGIADYSVELLTELSHHFAIEVVTNQTALTLPPSLSTLPRRSVDWFLANGADYDRVVYQLGNSPYHSHILQLLLMYPGVVVLHDFFLSSLFAYEETMGNMIGMWTNALYHSHGYGAVKERFEVKDINQTKNLYPCNLEVLQNAKKILVHSTYPQTLAHQWYGESLADKWSVIPPLRLPIVNLNRAAARKALGFADDAFVVCTFGMLAPTKLNHRLLNAWFSSQLQANPSCYLLFVGDNDGGDYGAQMLERIRSSQYGNRIRIIGWSEKETYNQYLEAADIGVQLRTMSRGETSAAILDCMSYGLATIVNAHGSAARLSKNAVWMLEDEFTDDELIEALETLWEDAEKRNQLATNAREVIHTIHSPKSCVNQYVQAIESAYQPSELDQFALIEAITALSDLPADEVTLKYISQAIANAYLPSPSQKQLLIDVSCIVRDDLKTGIERVVRAQLLELIKNPPQAFRIEPVYLVNESGYWHYRYARQFTFKLLNASPVTLLDDPIDICSGDIFYALDFASGEIIQASQSGLFLRWRALGVQLNVLVYDLLPILSPQFFPEGADKVHILWLEEIVVFADRLIAISASVADELRHWLKQRDWPHAWPLNICSVSLGADITASAPTSGLPASATELLEQIKKTTCFLMVGTIEPRKGYLQVLAAFEQLWKADYQVTLLIVGKEGWKHLPDGERRSIPTMIERISNHPELGKRLFWLTDVSDEYLQKIYAESTCLLVASEGEGFGLPLIEAAKHQLPIIARDLPIFREVGQKNAYYFKGIGPTHLSEAIKDWLLLHANKKAPLFTGMQWNTWEQSTKELLSILLRERQQRFWAPPVIRQKILDEHLNLIHKARMTMVSTLLPQGDIILDLGGANCPLYKMGYPHPFQKLTLIDLPPDQRHHYYKDIVIDDDSVLGQVVVRYTDMTTLEDIQDQSVDFVWSGQSIEHVPKEHGERMCREAYRVLKKGGAFCLDTPNRRLTELHTRPIGGGFIHPEHYIEYFPEQLKQILLDAGFIVKTALGICEMPETVATDEFHYEDFLFGRTVTNNVNDGYIQFFHCIKP